MTGVVMSWNAILFKNECKDCLHYRPMFVFEGECMCDVFDWKSKPMDYCSFAERKGV